MKGFARRFVCLICVISLCLTLALPARAIAVADDILVAVVLCFLAGAGIALSLPANTDRATVNSTVLDMLRSYASDVGSTLANLFPVAGVWLTGKAYRVNPTFGNALAGFVRWMQGGSYNLSDNSTVTVVAGGTSINGIDCFPIDLNTQYSIDNSLNPRYSYWVVTSMSKPLYYTYGYAQRTGRTFLVIFTEDFSNFSYRLEFHGPSESGNHTGAVYSFYQEDSFLGFLSTVYLNVTDYNMVFTGAGNGMKLIEPIFGDSGVVVSGGIDLVSGTIQNIGEIADTSQLVISSTAIPVGASDLDVASDAVMEQVLEGYGAIVAENDVVLADEGTLDPPVPPVVDDLYPISGLEEIFPFCIPFDLYEFAQILVAEPQAPKFTWEAAFPEAIGGTQTIELDFDTPTWNRIAQILRTMELLLFIVGLAFVTRQLLRG